MVQSQTLATVTTRFQPVFGALIAMFIGLERFLWFKIIAVAIATGGALIMCADVLLEGHENTTTTASAHTQHRSTGILFLCLGALSMSVFYVLQKPLVAKYPAVSLTAWSYFSGAVLMGLACLYYVPWSHSWADKVCGQGQSCSDLWHPNEIQWLAVGFAVILNSIIKYLLITLCNK